MLGRLPRTLNSASKLAPELAMAFSKLSAASSLSFLSNKMGIRDHSTKQCDKE